MRVRGVGRGGAVVERTRRVWRCVVGRDGVWRGRAGWGGALLGLGLDVYRDVGRIAGTVDASVDHFRRDGPQVIRQAHFAAQVDG
ncbi:hypothetical protein E2C01_015878 [Portunus trituberculatus]|uniref:Uncharacterized protein n=1 Tax=Portunus trituberculatus TaxID=210409 RepID=A0A5B7DMN2_PORTR|nr:hypothetical protein [Portunus trituberculatus]